MPHADDRPPPPYLLADKMHLASYQHMVMKFLPSWIMSYAKRARVWRHIQRRILASICWCHCGLSVKCLPQAQCLNTQPPAGTVWEGCRTSYLSVILWWSLGMPHTENGSWWHLRTNGHFKLAWFTSSTFLSTNINIKTLTFILPPLSFHVLPWYGATPVKLHDTMDL